MWGCREAEGGEPDKGIVSVSDGCDLRSSSRRVHERDTTTSSTWWSPIYLRLARTRRLYVIEPVIEPVHTRPGLLPFHLQSPGENVMVHRIPNVRTRTSSHNCRDLGGAWFASVLTSRALQASVERWWTASDPRYKPRPSTALRLCTGFPFSPLTFKVPQWPPSKRGGGYTNSEPSHVLYITLPCELTAG